MSNMAARTAAWAAETGRVVAIDLNDSRLFDEWMNAGGDLTFNEWAGERFGYLKSIRGLVVPYIPTLFDEFVHYAELP